MDMDMFRMKENSELNGFKWVCEVSPCAVPPPCDGSMEAFGQLLK